MSNAAELAAAYKKALAALNEHMNSCPVCTNMATPTRCPEEKRLSDLEYQAKSAQY